MKSFKFVIILCLLFIMPAGSSLGFFTQEDILKKDNHLPKPTHTDEDLIQKEIADVIHKNRHSLKVFGVKLKQYDQVKKYFSEQQFRPVWDHHKSVNRRVIRDLKKVIEDLPLNGLDPRHYHGDVMTKYLGHLNDFRDFAYMELLLTDSLFAIVNDVLNGQIHPKKVQEEWFLEHSTMDVYPIVLEALQSHNIYRMVSRLYPQTKEYENLKEVLAFYKSLLHKGPMPTVPKSKNKIEPGERGPHIAALRSRLKFTDQLPKKAGNHIELYDEDLAEAVKKFQRLNGLNDDGVIGLYTYEALNESIASKIKKIKANLERLRLMPEEEVYTEYLYINIPDYKLKAVKSGQVEFETRTVVGNYKWQTPVFNDEMEYVVINPKWNVPPKILKKEMLPKVQKNPDYIKKKNFVVYKKENGRLLRINPDNVDWSQANPEQYRFSQKSGGGNALGRLKFMFPNQHSVYLHDTPTKYLFKKDYRAYSHGCIRIEKPLEFAEYLLKAVKEKKAWDKDRIKTVIKSDKEHTVNLPKKIPIKLRYHTVWVDENNDTHFRKDIYLYDKKMIRALGM